MQVSHSFWNVLQQYFEESIFLPLFVMAGIWLVRKWNSEKRSALFMVCSISILFLYNEVSYRLSNLIGEGSTYYRFLWICPIALVISFFLIEVFYLQNEKKRWRLAGVGCLVVGLFSTNPITTWVYLPDNIYQIDSDVMQVADKILELTDGKGASLHDNGKIGYTVRQYNANIKISEKGSYWIDQILDSNSANYTGRNTQYYIEDNNSDYFALKKNDIRAYKVLEAAGISRIDKTDNYYIYTADFEQMREDWKILDSLDEKTGCYTNIEYIPISGVKDIFEFVYVSGFGADEEKYKNVVEAITELEADCVIINSQITDNKDWGQAYQQKIETSGMLYYSNNQEIQIIDRETFYICMIDNSMSVSRETIVALAELKQQKKPIVLILAEELLKESELYAVVIEDDSQIISVLSARNGRGKKSMLEDKMIQYSIAADERGTVTIIRVKGN